MSTAAELGSYKMRALAVLPNEQYPALSPAGQWTT